MTDSDYKTLAVDLPDGWSLLAPCGDSPFRIQYEEPDLHAVLGVSPDLDMRSVCEGIKLAHTVEAFRGIRARRSDQ